MASGPTSTCYQESTLTTITVRRNEVNITREMQTTRTINGNVVLATTNRSTEVNQIPPFVTVRQSTSVPQMPLVPNAGRAQAASTVASRPTRAAVRNIGRVQTASTTASRPTRGTVRNVGRGQPAVTVASRTIRAAVRNTGRGQAVSSVASRPSSAVPNQGASRSALTHTNHPNRILPTIIRAPMRVNIRINTRNVSGASTIQANGDTILPGIPQQIGLSKDNIEKLPSYLVETKRKDVCDICLEVGDLGQTMRILPCMHQFHLGCIDEWLLRSATCPVCRTVIEV